jgi:hypothetical protein
VAEKTPTGATVMVDIPVAPANCVKVVGLAVTEKSDCCTDTGTFTVLCNVPLVPVTVTVKVGVAAVQVTDKTLPVRVMVQPGGGVTGAVTASETVAVKPFTGFTEIVEVPATLGVVLIEAGLADRVKSTKWKVAELLVLDGRTPLVPVTVAV